MKAAYDLSCIGIGMANASLVLALNDIKSLRKIGMFEAEDSFDKARTWCFWGKEHLPHYLKPLISKSWSKWQVSDEIDTFQHNSKNPKQHYHCIKGADFYQFFMEQCHKSKHIELHFSKPVTDVQKRDKCLLFNTEHTATSITSNYIVDSRLDKHVNAKGNLFQCFVGVWLESSTALFDSSCVGLMEQMTVTNDGALRFVYILPIDDHRALYEVTYFSQSVLPFNIIKHEVNAKIAERFDLKKLRALTWEQGVIPMHTMKPQNHLKFGQFYTRNGIAGGHVRTSSGYTFLPTQRWAKEAAYQINTGQPFTQKMPISIRYRLMDRLFLHALKNNMLIAPNLFKLLIQRTSPDCFTQFMTESASFKDLTNIILAMPKRAFLRAL